MHGCSPGCGVSVISAYFRMAQLGMAAEVAIEQNEAANILEAELQERLRNIRFSILSTLQQYEDSKDPMFMDMICMHVEILIRMLECLNASEWLLDLFRHALFLLQDICENGGNYSAGISVPCEREDGRLGRPKLVISQEQLETLLEMRFDCPTIAELFGVSLSTIRRRMTDYGLTVRSCYSTLSDQELDHLVLQLKYDYPSSGYRVIDGILRSQGFRIQQNRIRSCMQRIDPNGAIVRWFDTIHRRKYKVQGPLSLWHIDGNHKLIR